MRHFMKSLVGALAIAALASLSVVAKDKVAKKFIDLPQATMVNGKLLKAGRYEIKFDENTNELRILKDGKLKATALAHLEARTGKARNTEVIISQNGGEAAELRGVTFHGWDRDVVVNESSTSGVSQ